jgi:hypothetical protein
VRDRQRKLTLVLMRASRPCGEHYITPEPVLYDDSVLLTFPSSTGMQHDERLAGLGILTRLLHVTYSKRSRILPVPKGKRWSEAAMHKSVYQRFDAGLVQQYDRKKHYRPDTLRNHVDFHVAFEAGIDQPRPDKTTEARAVDSEWRADKKLANTRETGKATDA